MESGKANTSYLCLQSGTGLTTADQQRVTGTYGTYYHAYNAGSDGSMKYYCVDGTAIANHMEKAAPNNLLWMAICLGMATDGLHAPLREKGVGVVYGYSQSVTFDGDYFWEENFWNGMKNNKTVAAAISEMKTKCGSWDYSQELYTANGWAKDSDLCSTITQAQKNRAAFPIVVSAEDTYPGQGKVDNLQTVYSTWTLKKTTEPTPCQHRRPAHRPALKSSSAKTAAQLCLKRPSTPLTTTLLTVSVPAAALLTRTISPLFLTATAAKLARPIPSATSMPETGITKLWITP